jgi:5-aminopentanamidase
MVDRPAATVKSGRTRVRDSALRLSRPTDYPGTGGETVRTIIACGQFCPAPGDIPKNCATIRSQAREAASARAALLLLPELCLSGYPAAREAAAWAIATDGPEMAVVRECAVQSGIDLCLGFIEAVGTDHLANSMAYIDRTGTVAAVYRKVHLWPLEREWAVAGSSFSPFVAAGISAGMWICYDTRFPEAARRLARAGATLGLAGSAWFGPAEEWELALRARALDNGIFVAGAALLGSFASAPFRATSMIVDPHGRILARARDGRAEVIAAPYDSEAVAEFRARLPLLADLKPDSYA